MDAAHADGDNLEAEYGRLLGRSQDHLSAVEILDLAAALLDVSHDLARGEGVQRVITLLEGLDSEQFSPIDRVRRDYCLGDAWGEVDANSRRTGPTSAFWETGQLTKRLLHLRAAAARAKQIPGAPVDFVCAVLNNLATALSSTGRLLAAMRVWNEALARNRQFAVANGNVGCALFEYGRAVADESHWILLWKRAWHHLADALSEPPHREAADGFRQYMMNVERVLAPDILREPVEWNAATLGNSEAEIAYRSWCLRERLFLHPLNDVGSVSIAAHDPVSTPDMTVRPDDGSYFQAFFNELKQEYVSARYLLYESLTAQTPHFSDRDVSLADTFDDPVYSLSSQKMRLAFRSTCSLFDKVAVFLNAYLALQVPEHKVTFRTIWFTKQDRDRGIRPELLGRENSWLRALFALSYDIFENTPGFSDTSEPDARRIYDIRNYAEHKLLRLHGNGSQVEPTAANAGDERYLTLSREEFSRHALRVMWAARESLMYASLMIREEEKARNGTLSESQTLPLPWVEFGYERRC